MSDYLTDFVQESEERITELNNALLTLEREPDDEEAMENIFRIAHTLKGNCGAMGLESASDLAHAIEDLLDAVRRDDLEVTASLMDIVFDGVDELETMIGEVAETGEIRTDPSATIEALREHLPDADGASEGVEPPTADEIDDVCARFEPPADDGHDVYLARLVIAQEAGINNGELVVDALIDAFDLIGTDPPRETIETGDYGGSFDAVFGTAVGEAAIASGLDPVEEVDEFEIVDVSDRFEGENAVAGAPGAESAADSEPGDGISSDEAQDLEVDDLLDEFNEFDNLDEMVDDVEDEELDAFEDMGEAGSFDDLLDEEDIDELDADPGEPPGGASDADDSPTDGTAASTADDAAGGDASSSADTDADDEVDDAGAVFNELKDEVEMVGFDELQDELEELEFDEFDEEEEVDMDELLGEDADDDSFLDDEEPSADAVDDILVGSEADAEPDTDEAVDEIGADSEADAALDDAVDEIGADSEADAALDDAVDEIGADSEADTALDDSVDEIGADSEADAALDEAVDEIGADSEADTALDEAVDEIGADSEADTALDEAVDEIGADSDETAASMADDAGPSDEATAAPDPDAETTAEDGVDDSAVAEAEHGETGTHEAGPDEPATDDGAVADGAVDDVAATDSDDVDTGETDTDAVSSDESVAVDERPDSNDAGSAEDATAPAADAPAASDDSSPQTDLEADDAMADAGDGAVADGPDDGTGSGTDDAATADSFGGADDEVEPTPAVDDDFGTADDESDPFDDGSFAADVDDSFADFSADATDSEPEPVDGFDSGFDEQPDGQSDDEAFPEASAFDTDETGFGEPASDVESESDSSLSAATSFGDDGSGPETDDSADIVRTIDEPEMEIPDVSLPETSDRSDAADEDDEIQSVRVDIEQVDSLLTLVEGLVTSRVRLRHAADADDDGTALDKELDALSDLTGDLQETVMDIRLVPLQTVTSRLPRVVRDIARDQDKQVAFEMSGETVELDRSILDRIGDPLIHLVRNAVDHGIEAPERREEIGKPREGTVEVHADRSSDRVTITVADDGNGLDPDRLRDEAVDAGVLDAAEADALSEGEAYDLIFHPGLSTADEVTDVSGRGVGMDVVKRTIEDLDGTVSIDSDEGEGTTVTMTLPVTVAIDEILFVESGGEEFGIPTKAVQDIESATAIETAAGEPTLHGDDGDYPVVELADVLETPAPGANGDGMVVRIRDEVREVALHCDHVQGQQEVVVKPYEGVMSGIPGLSGATVRGRGEVVNILDVTTL
ncbi:chemotaxis protein CheA [Natrinema pallidum]|uniref:Chemotaxis protein CheA n=1 Tax=Natrinema pallidum TaxID=69527 RepID=A0A4P9TGC3_9EURY|nr:chemotaxis protein CheA [Natrinema pallidum]QCW03903.1 chemotaxis protein CheA [Natrinema pallidum]